MKKNCSRFSLQLYTLCIVAILFCSSFTDGEQKIKSASWQILQTTDQIDIRYRYAECKLPSNGSYNENVYLQVVNKTNKPLTVEWDTEHWYDGKCIGCGYNTENHKTIQLRPLETKEGTCAENSESSLRILSRMLTPGSTSTLTDFNLKNIKVTTN